MLFSAFLTWLSRLLSFLGRRASLSRVPPVAGWAVEFTATECLSRENTALCSRADGKALNSLLNYYFILG